MANTRTPTTASILDALEKHVDLFVNEDRSFCPASVAKGLNQIHGHQSYIKGTAISTFNATHASDNIVCPVMHGQFLKDPEKGYAKQLHLGTTRIWNKDGTVNEERWQKFVDFVTSGQNDNEEKFVSKSRLHAYLEKCAVEDSQENDTGRQANQFFSSKKAQCLAASAAWDETFDRLTTGWVNKETKPNELEPVISLKLVRLFFENSKEAFKKAENQETPVEKTERPRLG